VTDINTITTIDTEPERVQPWADGWTAPAPEAESEMPVAEPEAAPQRRRRGRPVGSVDSRPRRKTSGRGGKTARPTGDVRAITRALAVAALDGDDRAVLAAACGCGTPDNTAAVALASLTKESGAVAALDTILLVATADPVAAGAHAVAAASRPAGLRMAWATLAALVPGLPAEPPGTPLEAGMSFAVAAMSAEAGQLERAGRVRDLLAE